MCLRILSYLILFASLFELTSTSSCQTTKLNYGCNFEVKCNGIIKPDTPSCNGSPNITLVLTNSVSNLHWKMFKDTPPSFDSKVREIKAINNSWIKMENSAFWYYPNTVRLDLAKNNITEIDSYCFRRLQLMEYLNLTSNNIESFLILSFYIADNTNNNLNELDLSNNKLKKLGIELNEVPHLRKLYLQNNQLSSISDESFKNHINLTHLYLQHNFITSVNRTLINLKSLTVLDIAYNRLIMLSSYEVNGLISMLDFNVSHNALTSVEANCFTNNTNLEKVDFSFNKIDITIEIGMFINNDKLNYLNFYNNRIVGIQENAFQHCNLSYLNLENNNITGDLKTNTMANLRNVTRMDLSRQSLTGIRNNSFTDMGNLVYLNLTQNSISAIEMMAFVNTSITVLDLSYNRVPDLLFLNNSLSSLTELYLNNNNITAVPKDVFKNKTELRKLDLSMNYIIRLEEYSLPLNKMEYLNFVRNPLTGSIKENVFSPATYLKFLDLSFCNITRIDNLAFKNLPVLTTLNLSNNYIEDIHDNSFTGVDNLDTLDVSNNNLIEFDLATDFPRLENLYLRNNQIENLTYPKSNSSIPIIYLDLSLNEISNVKFNNLKEIISLDLSNNNLTYINRFFVENNKNLQVLNMSYNNIYELLPGTFQSTKNLIFLNVSSNYIKKLRFGSLKGLSKMEILDLSKNRIEYLDVDTFHECDGLKTLIIDYNQIKTLDVERLILVVLKQLQTLSLGGNPISCKDIVDSMNPTFNTTRQIEIISIDKIYHEENVHGIKCGDILDYTLLGTNMPNTVDSKDSSASFEAGAVYMPTEEIKLLEEELRATRIELVQLKTSVAELTMTMKNFSDEMIGQRLSNTQADEQILNTTISRVEHNMKEHSNVIITNDKDGNNGLNMVLLMKLGFNDEKHKIEPKQLEVHEDEKEIPAQLKDVNDGVLKQFEAIY